MKTYKTYSNAFNWKTVIYSVQDVKLIVPITIENLFYWSVALALMIVLWLCRITIVNGLVHFGGVPIVLVMLMKNLNPEDKPSLVWLKDTIVHLVQDPKEIWGFKKPDRYAEEVTFERQITFRR